MSWVIMLWSALCWLFPCVPSFLSNAAVTAECRRPKPCSFQETQRWMNCFCIQSSIWQSKRRTGDRGEQLRLEWAVVGRHCWARRHSVRKRHPSPSKLPAGTGWQIKSRLWMAMYRMQALLIFTNKNEAQTSKVTCSKSHRWRWVEPGCNPQSLMSEAQLLVLC